MPLIVLGLIPYAIALATGSGWLMAFGVFFTVAPVDDIIILWMMRNLHSNELVQDHPSKVGLLVVSSTDAD
jgi:hypothetical protein